MLGGGKMAIPYIEESLPDVSTFGFDINHWAGINNIKGSQYDYEMSDCTNMSSDNFPYASPRKPRECVLKENGIKRIYKVDDEKIFYIDEENNLAYYENGIKNLVKYFDENLVEQTSSAGGCICTNNYDYTSVFYPNMMYVDRKGNTVFINHPLNLSTPEAISIKISIFSDEFKPNYAGLRQGIAYEGVATAYVTDITKRSIEISMILPQAEKYEYPYNYMLPKVRVRIYNENGEVKTHNQNTDYGEGCPFIQCDAKVTQRKNTYIIPIPDEIILEEGDYAQVKFGFYNEENSFIDDVWEENFAYGHAAEWYINGSFATLALDYGVVYNNRIVGVKGSDIRASALGEFSNFTEYADSAGNPSDTGAYATDVGSSGNFTGICAYNNVLLLFKKDIVYEMYGSMPYTITELCNTGCIDNDSICSIDGVLYWASPKGIVCYSGGVPKVISTHIGICTDNICKAGTDGRKYYVYDGHKTYVYDTYYQLWHIEDDKNIKMFYNQINELYMVCDDGIYKANSGSENIEWEFTTKDYNFSSMETKNLSKLWIRANMPKCSNLEIYVRQNGGDWSRVAVKTAEKDEMFDFKLRIKKCDSFTLKFKGTGDIHILDIHGKVTVGTSKHRSGNSLNVYRR